MRLTAGVILSELNLTKPNLIRMRGPDGKVREFDPPSEPDDPILIRLYIAETWRQ